MLCRSFLNTSFIWCSMSSMGGNLGLYGDVQAAGSGPADAIAAGASIVGVGLDPEGIDQNSAYWGSLLDGAWRRGAGNATSYLQQWGERRCGRQSAKAAEAWAILARTVYADAKDQVYEHHMAYCPTTMPDGSGWDRQHASERPTWYAPADLHRAWGLLLEASSECEPSAALTFDLVDVGREHAQRDSSPHSPGLVRSACRPGD
jgi:alpha-N-acetylglucosaminidase